MLRKSLVLVSFLGCLALLATQATGQKHVAPPPSKPLAPQEALKHFKLDQGLRIELVASEPQIESPVAVAWDADGRMFVVEMKDYPNGPAKGQPPEGRIKLLEDRDGDGVYESSKVWADELLFANGLLPWKDGLIVTAAPHIVWLRDTDGDGTADKKEIWWEGFATQNPQLRVSNPILGLDGWVYVANGLRGGKVVRHRPAIAPKLKKDEPEPDYTPIDLSGQDFRFDPITGKGEAISGMGQYGNTFDDWGNRFVCDNRHHLRHVVMENRYLKRNPYLAAPALVEDISILDAGPLSSGGKIYPISKNWTTSSLHEGRFTAACGVHVYRGSLLPKPYQGAAFTCDPTGNLVHMEVMEPKGATFQSKPHKQGVEFLASPDDWFRPVYVTSGPDGALYVVDMYRAVIEHPEFMPPELKNRPDLILGKDKGRIWRIVPEKHQTKAVRPKLQKAATKDLIATLENADGWWRTTAQRLLIESGKDVVNEKALVEVGKKSKSPVSRVHAVNLLARLFDADPRDYLDDGSPRVKEAALTLIKPGILRLEATVKRLLPLASGSDARLRFQLALALGTQPFVADTPPADQPPVKGIDDALAHILVQGADDKWTRLAVASSVSDRPAALIMHMLQRAEFAKLGVAEQASLLQEFAALVGARREPAEIEQLLDTLGGLKSGAGISIPLAAMTGLADGVTRRGGSFNATLAKLPKLADNPKGQIAQWLNDFSKSTRALAENAKADPKQRFLAVRFQAHTPLGECEGLLTKLLNEDPEQEIRLAAVRALGAHLERNVPLLLMKSWRSYTPAVRREVLEAMFRDILRIHVLLDEVQAKRVKPGDIDTLRVRQLLKHTNVGVRERATKLLRDSLPADRKEVLAKYQVSLLMDGNPKRGMEVFKKNCATCHKVAGIGLDVGPDIGDTRTKTLDALLTDILNPNQAIDNNYVNYVVTTKSGKTATGILAAETASSITLKRAEGQSDVILRTDIDEISSTGVSLMPEGLEKTINFQEMADLLHFLKNWRYLDGSAPTGK